MGTLKGFGQRALHLVDIENLAGGPFSSERLESLAAYLCMAGWGRGDLTYVAANRLLIKRLCFEARPLPCQWLISEGKDGADLALLRVAPVDWVTDRFSRLVIGSGDHIFTELATAAAARGTEVTVVSRPGSLSRTLSESAHYVLHLATPPNRVASTHLERAA
jgi:hypothetical protein